MPSIIDIAHLSRTGVVMHKVSEIKSCTTIMFFFVTSRSRTVRFVRNKELVLTNKQNNFGKIIISKGHTGEMFLTLSRTGNTRIC
jgi:hypothetical protein